MEEDFCFYINEESGRMFYPDGTEVPVADDFDFVFDFFSFRILQSDREKPLELKLNFIKNYLLPLVGERNARQRVYDISTPIEDDYNDEDAIYFFLTEDVDVINRFRNNASFDKKMVLLDFLIGLASFSGRITDSEMKTLRLLGAEIGISHYNFDFDRFESEYYNTSSNFEGANSSSADNCRSVYNIENDYKMFEIDFSVTNEDLKKAYHNQMANYHPDKVNHLGEHLKKFATEYCTKLNEAYERIKKERGMT